MPILGRSIQIVAACPSTWPWVWKRKSPSLVTGGAGFIGSNTVDGLMRRGHAVTVLDGGQAFNLGTGGRYTLNYTLRLLEDFAGKPAKVKHGPPRDGDIRDSQADISLAAQSFGYKPQINFEDGLRKTWDWYSSQS